MAENSGLLKDASITSLSGSSETLLAAQPGRSYLLIQNTGTANCTVNMTGGTAAAGGAACVTLSPINATGPNNCIEFSEFVPANAIKVIGTAGQPVLCLWA